MKIGVACQTWGLVASTDHENELGGMMNHRLTAITPFPHEEFGIEELAQRAEVAVRVIRDYQTRGLLPRPRRRGRAAIYNLGHLTRLRAIRALLKQKLPLDVIRNMVARWEAGRTLDDVILFEAALAQATPFGLPVTLSAAEVHQRLPGLLPTWPNPALPTVGAASNPKPLPITPIAVRDPATEARQLEALSLAHSIGLLCASEGPINGEATSYISKGDALIQWAETLIQCGFTACDAVNHIAMAHDVLASLVDRLATDFRRKLHWPENLPADHPLMVEATERLSRLITLVPHALAVLSGIAFDKRLPVNFAGMLSAVPDPATAPPKRGRPAALTPEVGEQNALPRRSSARPTR